jgi:photosystem II stability/assembly factor-like uncharacterized protein
MSIGSHKNILFIDCANAGKAYFRANRPVPNRSRCASLPRASKQWAFCLLAIFATVHSAAAVAGTNTWTSMGLQGGRVYDLAFHATTPSTMYAVAPNGFYRSTDSGATWQQTISTPNSFYFLPSALAVTPANPDHVYIGMGDGGAVRSVDRGTTLSGPIGPLLQGQSSTWGVAAARDGSVIYYAVNGSVYRSTDQGTSRQLRGAVPTDGLIAQIGVDPSDSQVVYASHYGGFYRSMDGAVTWQTMFVPTNLGVDGVWGFAIDPQDASRIWLATEGSLRVSVNGGSTWTAVLNQMVSDIDIDPATPNVVYASLLDGAVMRSADGGTSWTSLPVPQRATMGRPRLAIVPGQSNHLYVFGTTGIFSSSDAGSTWLRADAGIDATSPGRFSRTTAMAERVYFPIAEYGIGALRSDGSMAEVLFSPSLSFVAGVHPPHVIAVAAGGDQSRELVALLDWQTIAFSGDHGSNWSLASAPPAQVQIRDLKRAGSRTFYAATTGGVYRSEDGGDHWITSTGLPSSADVTSLVVTADPMIVFATITEQTAAGAGTLYRSADAGVTWAPTPGQVSGTALGSLIAHPNDVQVLFLGSAAGAFKTSDGGTTWNALQSEPEYVARVASPVAIDPVDPKILYFADFSMTSSRVFRSVDAGATFQNLMPDYFTGGRVVSMLIDAAQPDRLIASMESGGVREFSVSPDLRVLIAPPASAIQGRQATLTLMLTNFGPFDATAVRLEAQLLDEPTGVSATSGDGNCTVAANSLTCSTDVLRKDATMTVVLLATPTALGTFRVNATAGARQPDAVTANNSVSSVVTTVSATSPNGPTGGGGGGGGGVMSGREILALLALLALCHLKLSNFTRSVAI